MESPISRHVWLSPATLLVWLCVQTRSSRGDDIKEKGSSRAEEEEGNRRGIKGDREREREGHPSAMIRKY